MTRARNHRASALADESGMTLVEVMVAMLCGMLILFATLGAFEAFNRAAATSNRVTGAEDSTRHDVASMVEILRNAGAPSPTSGSSVTTVTRAGANDIVFLSTAWPGESAIGSSAASVERLCVDTTAKKIWFDGLKAGTAGPSDPGTNCPSTASGWQHELISANVANTSAQPLFRYGSTNPVRSVGLSLRTDDGAAVNSDTLTLYSGSTLRGALPPQVSSGDVTVVCNSDGSGKPLLSLSGSAPGGLDLSAAGAIPVGPGQVLLNVASHTSTTATLTVTNALGLQTLLFKDVTCP